MSELLDQYLAEPELAEELKRKIGRGSVRQLRNWRRQRNGPPFMRLGNAIMYPRRGFEEWLAGQIVQPVRSRRRAAS